MYFITKRKSETGRKFAEVELKMLECFEAQKKLSREIGFTSWRSQVGVAYGGISSVCFSKKNITPDKKVWRNAWGKKNEWMPKRNSKEGKNISEKMQSLPVVTTHDLNKCIGFKSSVFNHIGFGMNNKTYFGFIVKSEWKTKIPGDCKEVTYTEYKKLFKIKNEENA